MLLLLEAGANPNALQMTGAHSRDRRVVFTSSARVRIASYCVKKPLPAAIQSGNRAPHACSRAMQFDPRDSFDAEKRELLCA